jgi:hypothetical protein
MAGEIAGRGPGQETWRLCKLFHLDRRPHPIDSLPTNSVEFDDQTEGVLLVEDDPAVQAALLGAIEATGFD